jgi:Flp pilus assembly protein TadG
MLKRFLRDRDGNVAMIFAVSAVPLILAAGAAADYTKFYNQQEIVQDALDAAALAANRLLGIASPKEVEAEAEAFFLANTSGKVTGTPPLTVVLGKGTVELSTTLTVPTHFLSMIGIDQHDVNLHSRSIAGDATYEVVMVLDNSGSMAGSKISSLRTAAGDLTNALFEVNASNPNPDPIKIGIVPFAASVNVGGGFADAGWMDTGANGTYHSENFVSPKSRFELFDELEDITWQGCVEARPQPYDVTDDAPNNGAPETLFVPMFAPDEPDIGTFPNDYISDTAGACAPMTEEEEEALPQEDRQARICKYDGADLAAGSNNGIKFGPNYNCTAEPLMEMSPSQDVIDAKIATMKADGLTNIHAGVMWGWRLLSPGVPFTGGRPYDDEDNRKILIVMTDGVNTYSSYDTYNKSMYGAFGYIAKNHLGTTSSNNGTVIGKMNERTLAACTNVKAEGILVYTIAFQVSNQATLTMLRNCATSAKMAFQSNSNSDLIAAFHQIAQEISLLRLEE